MINKILLTSMIHSGTYFWMEFLKQHPEVHNTPYMAYQNFDKSLQRYKTALNGHSQNKKLIIQHHLVADGNFIPAVIGLPTIWSVRDPILSCISMIKRSHPADFDWQEMMTRQCLDAFANMIKIYKMSDNILPVPVDARNSPEERLLKCESVLSHLQLSPDTNLCKSYANAWNPKNKRQDTKLNSCVQSGNKLGLRVQMTPFWNGLKQHEGIMRPFLEELGYENLVWWS